MDLSRPLLEGEARFDLKRQLADTLQGRIYSATDRNTQDYCVVKETWKQLVRMKRSRDGHRVPEDFENEKAIMSYLSNDAAPHPGFVRILDEWEDEHCYFYAMEGCRGGELFQYIKDQHTKGSLQSWVTSQSRMSQKPMKENNEWTLMVKTMFRQLVDCVSWMHNRGVCHLDLSLENSMIHDRRKKHVKIIDFGLGKYFGGDNLMAINQKYNKEKSEQSGMPSRMNSRPKYNPVNIAELDFSNNQRVGKTGYMAPEVYAREKYDARAADIWSLGVMLFMMCIGAPPYEYPTEQNAAFRFIISGKLAEVLRHWRRLRLVTEEQLDLMVKIFQPEKDRITMDEILKHPFVDLKRRPLFVPKQPARVQQRQLNQQKREKAQKRLQQHLEDTKEEQQQQQQQQPKSKASKASKASNNENNKNGRRDNNDDQGDSNNNGGSSPNGGGTGGGGKDNSGGDNNGGGTGGGANGSGDADSGGSGNDTNNGQKQNSNGDYTSPTAQGYASRMRNTESNDVEALRNILKDVEKKRNEVLRQQATHGTREVNVGNGDRGNGNGAADAMSPRSEDDRKDIDIDAKDFQLVIDELAKLQDRVQEQLDAGAR